MRWFVMVFLSGGLLVNSGCTNAIMGVLLAPESVIAGAGGSLAQAGAETLSGASLEELADVTNTVTELDRIIQENPDAVNTDRLRDLRDQLDQQNKAGSGPDQRQLPKSAPRPRRLGDTPLPNRNGDRLTVLPPGELQTIRRSLTRPDTVPITSDFHADPRPVHAMSLKPVRLR